MDSDASYDRVGRLTRLACIATRSDEIVDLIAVMWAECRRPIGVVDREGKPLARAPACTRGRAALAAAREAASDGGRASVGWLVHRLVVGRELLGYAALAAPSAGPGEAEVLELGCVLLADQLRRAALSAAATDERRRAFMCRLVTDRHMTVERARREARRARLAIAEMYWPAILVWERGEVPTAVLAGVQDLVRRYAREGLAVPYDEGMVVLLLAPEDGGDNPRPSVHLTVEQIVRFASTQLPGIGFRAIVASGAVGVGALAVQVAALERLRGYPRRDRPAVVVDRSFALDLLMEGLDRTRAFEFVGGQLGELLTYDRTHGTDLADTLELALELEHRDEAVRKSYMHRGTFRRRVNRAIDFVDNDMHDPDERFALHLALKLHRVLARSVVEDSVAPPTAPSPRGGRRDGFQASDRSAAIRFSYSASGHGSVASSRGGIGCG